MFVNKGKISAVVDKTHATVVPAFSDTPVTTELVIPFFLWECLEPDMDVIYTQFPDNTGMIVARMDGEWNHRIWDGVEIVTKDVKVTEGNIKVAAGNVEASGNVKADGDVKAGAISLKLHTHLSAAPGSPTKPPQ